MDFFFLGRLLCHCHAEPPKCAPSMEPMPRALQLWHQAMGDVSRKIGRYRKIYFQHNLQKTVRYIFIQIQYIYVHITQITGILHVLHVYCMFDTYLQYISSIHIFNLQDDDLGSSPAMSCHVCLCSSMTPCMQHMFVELKTLSSAPNPMAAPTGAPVGYAKKIR